MNVCSVCGEPIKVEQVWGLGDDLRSHPEAGRMIGHRIFEMSCGCKGLVWRFGLSYAIKMNDEMMKYIVSRHNDLAKMMEEKEMTDGKDKKRTVDEYLSWRTNIAITMTELNVVIHALEQAEFGLAGLKACPRVNDYKLRQDILEYEDRLAQIMGRTLHCAGQGQRGRAQGSHRPDRWEGGRGMSKSNKDRKSGYDLVEKGKLRYDISVCYDDPRYMTIIQSWYYIDEDTFSTPTMVMKLIPVADVESALIRQELKSKGIKGDEGDYELRLVPKDDTSPNMPDTISLKVYREKVEALTKARIEHNEIRRSLGYHSELAKWAETIVRDLEKQVDESYRALTGETEAEE